MNNTQIEESVKALFFAQYLYQLVYVNIERDLIELVTSNDIKNASKGICSEDYLLLRSIDQLSDEEIIQATSIHQDFPANPKKIDLYKIEINGYSVDAFVYQYLLRIGILLPFTYLDKDNKPVTLQPGEIISLGLAKYQQS